MPSRPCTSVRSKLGGLEKSRLWNGATIIGSSKRVSVALTAAPGSHAARAASPASSAEVTRASAAATAG
jgi:hypothetical protein